MPKYHLQYLGREAYVASTALIQDAESTRFANQSLAWWDRHYSWNSQGCSVLCDEDNTHLCYLFFKIDRYGEYLTLYNLFTPLISQRQGHATQILRLVLDHAITKHVRRITFSSVSDSLDFYTYLGFMYWGINDIGDFYCNLPLPKDGLAGIIPMTQTYNHSSMIGHNLAKIFAKVDGNERHLSSAQALIHETDVLKLGKHYAYDQLQVLKAKEV